MFLKHLKSSVIILGLFTIITGLLYPLMVTGIAQLIFPDKANGSLVRRDGKVVGTRLVGQPFSEPKYFWSRPSATSPFPYNAGSSSGSNYGPLNPTYLDSVQKRVHNLRQADPGNMAPIPVDLVTASGSGLDPHISLAAALYQIPRIARVRGLYESTVRSLVDSCTDGRQWGFLGEPSVNVLELNISLDTYRPGAEVK